MNQTRVLAEPGAVAPDPSTRLGPTSHYETIEGGVERGIRSLPLPVLQL